MALYTRLWAAGKPDLRALAFQSPMPLTILAALELINTTSTPTSTEIKLSYSLWESQVHSNDVTSKTYLSHQASA